MPGAGHHTVSSQDLRPQLAPTALIGVRVWEEGHNDFVQNGVSLQQGA